MRARPIALALALSLAGALPLAAQGTCEINNQTSCTFGNDAAHAISVTITVAARLTASSTTVTLPAPGVSSFDAGFGTPASVGLDVRSNTNWAVTIAAVDPLWGATPGTARQDKPASDLQFGLAAMGPFTDISVLAQSLTSGAATGTAAPTLYLRAKYDWIIDAAGAYTLPIQLVLTAP